METGVTPGHVALRWGARGLIRNPRHRGMAALTFRQFNRVFTNTWPADAARAAYERYSAPAPEQVITDRVLARVRWRDPSGLFSYSYDDRAPLLIIAAEHDALVPPSVAARNYQRYSSMAETDFPNFPDGPTSSCWSAAGRRSPTTFPGGSRVNRTAGRPGRSTCPPEAAGKRQAAPFVHMSDS
ncbi:MAG: hypothetical protein ACRDOD_03430 [Streptosporangiaceae bacterium]